MDSVLNGAELIDQSSFSDPRGTDSDFERFADHTTEQPRIERKRAPFARNLRALARTWNMFNAFALHIRPQVSRIRGRKGSQDCG